jgi:hypothetical protein
MLVVFNLPMHSHCRYCALWLLWSCQQFGWRSRSHVLVVYNLAGACHAHECYGTVIANVIDVIANENVYL